MRKLFCRQCGYDLTSQAADGASEFACPECGSIAEMRRAQFKLQNWWLRPALGSLVIGAIPLVCAVIAVWNWPPSRFAPFTPWFWPYLGPFLACMAAYIVFPRDVPGRASFGRLRPFLVLVFVASIGFNFALAFAWAMCMAFLFSGL